MNPYFVYTISPSLILRRKRWQAEIEGQKSPYARRERSERRAIQKISWDEEYFWTHDKFSLMQRLVLPFFYPIRSRYDKLCRDKHFGLS